MSIFSQILQLLPKSEFVKTYTVDYSRTDTPFARFIVKKKPRNARLSSYEKIIFISTRNDCSDSHRHCCYQNGCRNVRHEDGLY